MFLKGEEIAKQVLNSTGGAYVKRYFDIDCVNFSWVDLFLKDVALRLKIQARRDEIQALIKSPLNKDELRKSFESALSNIHSDRLSWFAQRLQRVQNREFGMLSSHNILAGNGFISPMALTKQDIDAIFAQLPEEGVKSKEVNEMIERRQAEIVKYEKIIDSELSPADRWKYEDNGRPIPYPQGCQWTQYVAAWKRVAARFDLPVSVEGSVIKNDKEENAYFALGFKNLTKISPLGKPR